jgi:hypothetical protein
MDPYSPYSYQSTYQTQTELDPGMSMAIVVVALIFALIAYVIVALLMGRIFKKAGVEQWKAWVPVYNQWVFLEIGGQKGWIALLSLLAVIPFVGVIGSIVALVFACIAAYNIGLKLQKEGWFVILYILVSPVWLVWLAFDSSRWNPAAVPAQPQNAPVAASGQQPVAPQPPVAQPPVPENQNNTPPTPPIAS